MRRHFPNGGRISAYADAEDFMNEMVFGGDDENVVAEIVEVWPDEDSYDRSCLTGAWGELYVVWEFSDEKFEREVEALGPWIDRKGRTGRF